MGPRVCETEGSRTEDPKSTPMLKIRNVEIGVQLRNQRSSALSVVFSEHFLLPFPDYCLKHGKETLGTVLHEIGGVSVACQDGTVTGPIERYFLNIVIIDHVLAM
jgi:hypothetical protein